MSIYLIIRVLFFLPTHINIWSRVVLCSGNSSTQFWEVGVYYRKRYGKDKSTFVTAVIVVEMDQESHSVRLSFHFFFSYRWQFRMCWNKNLSSSDIYFKLDKRNFSVDIWIHCLRQRLSRVTENLVLLSSSVCATDQTTFSISFCQWNQ